MEVQYYSPTFTLKFSFFKVLEKQIFSQFGIKTFRSSMIDLKNAI